MDSLQRHGTIPYDHLQPLLRLAPRTVRFWATGLAVAGAVCLATVAFVLLAPKRYRSEAVLLYREGLQWRSDEAANPRRVGQRLRDTLLARSQLAKLIRELELFPGLIARDREAEAVEEMRSRITFRFESDIYVLSYVGDTPAQARRVATRLTEVLAQENARLRSQQAELARQFLDSEKKRMEKEVAEKETEQIQFLARHPEFAQEPGVGATLRRTRPPAATPAPSHARDGSALGALRREEQRIRRQLGAAVEDPAVAARLDAEAKLRDARRDLADRRGRFTDQHPDVRAAAARVADAEAAHRRAVDAAGTAGMDAAQVEALRERLARLEQEIAASLREPAPQAVPPVRNEAARLIVSAETEWARLGRELGEARERLSRLDTQQFSASMTASMVMSGQTAQLITIDPANLPAVPIGLGRTKRLALGAALALALGLLAMLARALMDDLLSDRIDVDRLEFAPVFSEVPRLALPGERRHWWRRGEKAASPGPAPPPAAAPARPPRAGAPPAELHVPSVDAGGGSAALALSVEALPVARGLTDAIRVHRPLRGRAVDPRVFMIAAPEGAAASSFRILRHKLRPYKARTILVTSPRRGEGRTLTAVNLALALGETGTARVLLVELDSRNPSLARWLGFEPPVCLREQLEAHRGRPEDAWDVVEVAPGVHVAALSPGAAGAPLPGVALGAGLARLRDAGYTHVVLDGPPILEGGEVNVIEECADGVLIALRARSSRALELRRAAEQLGFGKLLGSVLVGA